MSNASAEEDAFEGAAAAFEVGAAAGLPWQEASRKIKGMGQVGESHG